MAISVRGTSTNDSGGVAVTSLDLVVPASTVAGDVGYIIVDTANTSRTGVAPSGWTMVGGTHASTTGLRAWLYRRTMTGGQAGSTVTVGLSGTGVMTGGLIVFAGGDAAGEVITGPTTSGTDNTSWDTVANTPAANDALLIAFVSVRYASTSTSGGGAPSGWTEVFDYDNGATTGSNGRHGVYCATKQLTGQSGVSQSSVAGTWVTSARDHTWTISLAPAPVPAEGSGSGSWGFTGSATGQRSPKSTGTGTFTYAGTAAGVRAPKSTGAGTLTVTGAATGQRTPRASAAGSWSLTGTAVGSAPEVENAEGVGAGSLTYTGTGTGRRTPRASGTGTLTFTGTATGVTVRRGTGAGITTFAGTATGRRTPRGSSTGAWTFSGSAVGVRPSVAVRTGSGAGTFTFSGTAQGSTTRRGTATGTWAYAGSAQGARSARATAAGTWSFIGVAQGGVTVIRDVDLVAVLLQDPLRASLTRDRITTRTNSARPLAVALDPDDKQAVLIGHPVAAQLEE